MKDDTAYDAQLDVLHGSDPRAVLWTLIKDDIRAACDLFLPVYRESGRHAGFVSIEVDPAQAFDTEATVVDGLALHAELDRPNLMVKVPGTEQGLSAITRLLAEGVNVNVTLLFSVARYEMVIAAHREGIRRLAEAGGDLGGVASVASFFVSRVDNKVDALLPDGHPLRGQAAIANARAAYALFRERGADLTDIGADARPQLPLWASTSTKNPAYRDTLYVEELAGPDSVDTLPEATLSAFRDHGVAADRLTGTGEEARAVLEQLASEGVDLDQVTKELETEGVEAFVTSFEEAVATVAEAVAAHS